MRLIKNKIRPETIALLAILILSAWLRISGYNHNLPPAQGSDEGNMIRDVLGMSWSKPYPLMHWYGQLPFYLYRVILVFANTFSLIIQKGALDQAAIYITLRIFTALISILTTYLTFLFGKELKGSIAGLFAAAFFTFSPEAIRIAHYATPDPVMGLFSALTLVFLAQWANGNAKSQAYAAVSLGLAAATKLNALILLLPFLIVYLWKTDAFRSKATVPHPLRIIFSGMVLAASILLIVIFSSRQSILAVLASWTGTGILKPDYIRLYDKILFSITLLLAASVLVVVGTWMNNRQANQVLGSMVHPLLWKFALISSAVFLIFSPFTILHFPVFARDFFFQINKTISGAYVAYEPNSRSYIAGAMVSQGIDSMQYILGIVHEWGIPAFGVLLFGLVSVWREKRLLFLSFGTALIISLVMSLSWKFFALRYLYSSWILFPAFIGTGVVYSGEMVGKAINRGTVIKIISSLVIGVACLVVPIRGSISTLQTYFLKPSTLNVALEWMIDHIPRGMAVLRETKTPEIGWYRDDITVTTSDFAFEEASPEQWHQRGIDLIVLGSDRQSFYQSQPDQFRDVLDRYLDIEKHWVLIQSFEAGKNMSGSPVYIYQWAAKP